MKQNNVSELLFYIDGVRVRLLENVIKIFLYQFHLNVT